MKNIIAYSLFNYNAQFYGNYAAPVFYACKVLYPNWEIRLYHDDTIKEDIKTLAKELHIKLIFVKKNPKLCEGMLWRIKPLFDPDVKYLICRDLDSLPCPKERYAIEEFILNRGSIHNIVAVREHNIPVMGGLCGFDAEEFRKTFIGSSEESLIAENDLTIKGSDQTLLLSKIWPLLKHNSIEHRFAGEGNYFVKKTFTNVNYDLQIETEIPRQLIEEANTISKFPGHAGFNVSIALNFYQHLFDEGCTLIHSTEIEPQYAVFSSNINSHFDFFLPLTAAMWKRISFKPFIFLVGKELEWIEKRKSVIDYLKELNCAIEYVDPIDPVKSHSISQIIRLYAFCHIDKESDIITSDADIWPLANSEYWKNPTNKPIKSWTFTGIKDVPMCYVKAKSLIWRTMIVSRLPYGSSARQELIEQLSAGPGLVSNLEWEYDQKLLAARIQESGMDVESIYRIPDHKLDHRVDRGCWEIDYPNDIDTHLLRPGWNSENWPRIKQLFLMYLPDQKPRIEKYYTEYMENLEKWQE